MRQEGGPRPGRHGNSSTGPRQDSAAASGCSSRSSLASAEGSSRHFIQHHMTCECQLLEEPGIDTKTGNKQFLIPHGTR